MSFTADDILTFIPQEFENLVYDPWEQLAYWAMRKHLVENAISAAYGQTKQGKKTRKKAAKAMKERDKQLRVKAAPIAPLARSENPTRTHKSVTKPCAECGGRHLESLSSCPSQTKLKVA